MDSGELDKKVVFYGAVPVQDENTGTLSNSPSVLATVWAKKIVTDSSGSSQSVEAGEVNFNDEVKWKIRKYASFTPDKTMYILHDNKKYIIHRVRDKDTTADPFYYISTTVQT